MNRRYEQRLRKLEVALDEREPHLRKSILPEWLLEDFFEGTGLPYHNNEVAWKSLQELWRRQKIEEQSQQDAIGDPRCTAGKNPATDNRDT